MTEAGWRSVLVVDAKGKVLGVVSGRSLLRFVKNGIDENLPVRDVMHARTDNRHPRQPARSRR